MEKGESKVLIIGAGLTGLTLAYLLEKENIPYLILDARNRIGGRIHTLYEEGLAPLEMGATWLGKQHTNLTAFLEELGIGLFVQEYGSTAIFEPISTSPPQLVSLPPNEDPTFRIKGGTASIIDTLSNSIPVEKINLNQKVHSINFIDSEIETKTEEGVFHSSIVVSTLPPFLFNQNIKTEPSLDQGTKSILNKTHTWMGESIKICLRYEHPFWRDQHYSGTIFSNVGPIPEMYDHSNYEDDTYALKGFFNGSYYSLTKEERLDLVMIQLKKYFGSQVTQFTSYHETVWRNESYTYSQYKEHVLPHENNGHPIFQKSQMNGRLYIGGAETARTHPGYMEGAVVSAQDIFKRIKENIESAT